MNMKTGLFGLGLLVATGALMVSCSGDSDSGSNGSGASSSGGTNSAGTNNSAAGTNNNTGGTNSNGGTNNNTGGTNNNNGGTNNQQGGDGPNFPQGGDGPNFPQGGAGFGIDSCEGGVADGEDCMQGDQPCQLAGGDFCFCQRMGQQQRTWNCNALNGGDGGAGPGNFTADCGNDPMTGDECDGIGVCEGSQSCGCFQGNVFCQ